MSATDRRRGLCALAPYYLSGIGALGLAGAAYAAGVASPSDSGVAALLKARLPKTEVSRVDCRKVGGLCEVTAGANLFYVDGSARYLVIGRIYDMETRQDLTAARLLEMNPDMLVGGAAKANAEAAGGEGEGAAALADLPPGSGPQLQKAAIQARPKTLSLAGLPKDGAIVWGASAGETVTVFTDFRCGYCRALSNVLRGMNVRVVERPISILGSRDLANQVYCARNREEALHAAYAGEPVRAEAACDTHGLDANEAFAKANGLGGTPIIVRSDGAVIEGYRPKAFLESWIKGGKS